ncbi:MAG: hypothetical protein ACRETC_08845 [Gammaproteobacteria bacterium]
MPIATSVGGRRLDLLLSLRDSNCLGVEICVAHPVDEEKATELRRWRYPSIEIFVNPEVAYDGDAAFAEHVMESAERHWVHWSELYDPDATWNDTVRASRLIGLTLGERVQGMLRRLRAVSATTHNRLLDALSYQREANSHRALFHTGEIAKLFNVSARRVSKAAERSGLKDEALIEGIWFGPNEYTASRIYSVQAALVLWWEIEGASADDALVAQHGLALVEKIRSKEKLALAQAAEAIRYRDAKIDAERALVERSIAAAPTDEWRVIYEALEHTYPSSKSRRIVTLNDVRYQCRFTNIEGVWYRHWQLVLPIRS